MFDTTLEENLRLARRDATEADLRAVLRRASLLSWTDALPDGLATPSGPQWGRASRAASASVWRWRGCCWPALRCVVADEPGEHLDTPTADALVADLLATASEQALLLITHRLAGLEAVDEVIVLEGGRAVERGTHAELLAAAGRYASMWLREAGAIGSARGGGRSPE